MKESLNKSWYLILINLVRCIAPCHCEPQSSRDAACHVSTWCVKESPPSVSALRKLKHTVNKVLSLRDLGQALQGRYFINRR
jgi:hypothetical protein